MDRANTLRRAGLYAVLAVATAAMALPFFWMVLTSLKPPAEVMAYPPSWWPGELRWENYVEAWNRAPFGRFYLNSVVSSLGATAMQVVFSLMMAYAFVYLRVPGKRLVLAAVLATMFIPDEMKLVPNYLLVSRLGWRDTLWALTVPPAAHAFPVFVFYQYFRMLPRDLVEAARVDGASHFRVLFQVLAPVSRPVVYAVALVAFLGRWNDFLWPLVVTDRVAMRTLPVGLAYLRDAETNTANWHLLMAGAVFVIMPVVLVYVLTQRHFVTGIIQGALKG